MNKQITVLSLSGGLGNQFFQVFAAYHYSQDAQLKIEVGAHNPEKNFEGKLAIEDFSLLKNLGILNTFRFPIFIQRVANLNLRVSLREKKRLHEKVLVEVTKYSLVILLFSRFFKKFEVVTPTEVGVIPPRKASGNLYLNGYFQNKETISALMSKELFQVIFLNELESVLQTWISRAKQTKPVILHFRIGDYREHQRMGVLDLGYFSEAIKRVRSVDADKEVWVFSDEPISAIEQLRASGNANLLEIPKFSPAASLELMRYGSNYIISNSTFSWWAAVLSYNSDAGVWAPKPWFKNQLSPGAIYLENWQTVGAWQSPRELIDIRDLEENG